ncbi:MAG: hypothetical protein IPK04_18785 [Bdellovibrionales bacterium]|nr:hypothetical protein [Bdellovibrionales bacterium]
MKTIIKNGSKTTSFLNQKTLKFQKKLLNLFCADEGTHKSEPLVCLFKSLRNSHWCRFHVAFDVPSIWNESI